MTEGFTLSFAKAGRCGEPWTCTLCAEALKCCGCALRQEVLLTSDAGRCSYSSYRAEDHHRHAGLPKL